MEVRDLEYLLKSIDETLSRNERKLADLRDSKEPLHNDPAWLKTHVLASVHGELAGQLLFVKDRLRKDLATKKAKKFYQFWK